MLVQKVFRLLKTTLKGGLMKVLFYSIIVLKISTNDCCQLKFFTAFHIMKSQKFNSRRILKNYEYNGKKLYHKIFPEITKKARLKIFA